MSGGHIRSFWQKQFSRTGRAAANFRSVRPPARHTLILPSRTTHGSTNMRRQRGGIELMHVLQRMKPRLGRAEPRVPVGHCVKKRPTSALWSRMSRPQSIVFATKTAERPPIASAPTIARRRLSSDSNMSSGAILFPPIAPAPPAPYPLLSATEAGDDAAVEALLPTSDVNLRSPEGWSPLIMAAKQGHIALVKRLLAAGALPNPPDESHTPLRGAAIFGHASIIRILLSAGADVNHKSQGGKTPLMGAVMNGHLEATICLLLPGSNIDAVNEFGETALMLAEARGHTACARMIRFVLHHKMCGGDPFVADWLSLPDAPSTDFDASAASSIITQLRRQPIGRISQVYLYDAEGSRLYDEICKTSAYHHTWPLLLPTHSVSPQTPRRLRLLCASRVYCTGEYYPTSKELELLTHYSTDIAKPSDEQVATKAPLQVVVELGAGDGHKTMLLLEALCPNASRTIYAPIDVSAEALHSNVAVKQCSGTAAGAAWMSTLETTPLIGRFEECLPQAAGMGGSRVFLFLGSSLGNFSDDESVELMSLVARQMESSSYDRFLVGVDLPHSARKPAKIVSDAYNDARGVTAAFTLTRCATSTASLVSTLIGAQDGTMRSTPSAIVTHGCR